MQRHQQSPSSQLLQTECLIYPDSVTVNGDLLTADGRMKGKLVRLQIQLKSENEQQKWRMDAPSFTRLSCMGRFQSVNTSRNQHAFDYEKYLQDKNYFGLFVVKKYRVLSGSAWQTLLSQLRFYCIKQVREQLSRKASQYVQALVFGYKYQEISSEVLKILS